MKMLTLMSLALVIGAFGVAAQDGGLPPPPPPPVEAENLRCEAPYNLAPGERIVITCRFRAPPLFGLIQPQSRSRSVDVSIVGTDGADVSFALSNRADRRVSGEAIIDIL